MVITEKLIKSKPLYLHFLDREFLTALKIYNVIPSGRILDDLHWLLLSNCDFCFCSTSLIFENKYAKIALKKYKPLFQAGQIRLALHDASLYDFIESKRQQYEHAKTLYRFYFDESWINILNIGPYFMQRKMDTSNFLENQLLSNIKIASPARFIELIEKRIDVNDAIKKIEILTPYAIEALKERGALAVTKLLFKPFFELKEVNRIFQRAFEFLISEKYISSYLDEYNATIATGLSSISDIFSYLCPNYPFEDLTLWRLLYYRIGIGGCLKLLSSRELTRLREEPFFHSFIDTVRNWWGKIIINRKIPEKLQVKIISQEIRDIQLKIDVKLLRIGKVGVDELAKIYQQSTEQIHNFKYSIKENFQIIRRQTMKESKKVFVAYGRDERLRTDLFSFLRSAGLSPMEYDSILVEIGGASDYIGSIIDKAMDSAQAIVLIFSGDEIVRLRPELIVNKSIEDSGYQPRPNVIFEAGIALSRFPDRTIIVEIGQVRQISDLLGRHVVRLNNTPERRKTLLQRLAAAGCDVDITGSDWLIVGNFDR
jgi:predicted nucleotide-binding protein